MSVTMREMLDAGVHFGHQTKFWNPKMAPYIFGARNNIHIMDLQQTYPMMGRAMQAVRDVVAGGGRVLFVGTKNQASPIIEDAAKRCGQHYINHRWLGGLLTNWKTVNQSIKRMNEMEEELANPGRLTKKEILSIQRKQQKLEMAIGGIRNMGGTPDIIFVIDTNRESLAIEEAKVLGIPIVAVIDSNSCPDSITYPIPGNDDAIRAITLYCELISGAVLDGLQAEMSASGVDVGASANLPIEDMMMGDAAKA